MFLYKFVLLILCLKENIQIFFFITAFSSKSFSGKTSFPVKNSYLQTFTNDKAEILAVCLSKIILSFVLLFVINCFDFLPNTHFCNKFLLNLNGLSDDKVVSFTKNEYGSLV